jgi:glycerol kinase
MRIAGIDQGTTSTKGLVIDGDVLLPLPSRPHAQRFPAPGRVEHDAAELLANVEASIEAAVALGARTIGLANQGETVLAWDRDSGRPLGRAIVWQDQRTSEAVAAMAAAGEAETIARISGLPLDCYFSASKLRWLLDNTAGARDLMRRGRLGLGTTDSYFIERLTGRYVTDPTTASRTSLMNLGACAWDATLCDRFGVPIEALPEIIDDSLPIGDIETPGGGAVLAASAVDQVAALYGHGCRSAGEGKLTVGTGAFALIVEGEGRPAELPRGSIPTAAWRTAGSRVYAADGGVYSAASALDWLTRAGILGDLSELEALDGPSAAGRGLIFVPALAGLAFPHWDRSAAGLFIGIDGGTERADLIKAVLEGVAFRVAELLDGLRFGGDAVPVDGGLARSSYFVQFLADVSGRPLRLRDGVEVTSLGMAQLAAAATEVHDPSTVPAWTFAAEAVVDPRMSGATATALRATFADAIGRSRGWRK